MVHWKKKWVHSWLVNADEDQITTSGAKRSASSVNEAIVVLSKKQKRIEDPSAEQNTSVNDVTFVDVRSPCKRKTSGDVSSSASPAKKMTVTTDNVNELC